MNWSTRLRRWVRIRTPPVREASMKPTAATVLPAPVACSNQKRRSAPGSSGASSIVSSSAPRLDSSQSWGSSSARQLSSSSASSPRPPRLLAVGRRSSAPAGVAGAADRPRAAVAAGRWPRLLLGHQLGQRAGEGVDLVRVQLGAVAQLRRLLGEQPLEPEQQREVPAPLDRGLLGARRRSRPGRRRAPGAARCPGPAPRGPRRRAGRARGRTPPRARCRRLKELPLPRQLRWCWP